jgi:hypothetical protein
LLKVLFLCRNHPEMNEKDLNQIDELKLNIKRLIGFLEQKTAELDRVADEKKGLEFQLAVYKQEHEALLKRYENLKVANAFAAETDGKEAAKGKINKIVREIDKCIALLNE